MSYTVTLGNGHTVKRHVDQVRAGLADTVPSEPDIKLERLPDRKEDSEGCLPSVMDMTMQPPSPESQDLQPAPETQAQPDSEAPVVRRSQRERHPPVRLKDFVR